MGKCDHMREEMEILKGGYTIYAKRPQPNAKWHRVAYAYDSGFEFACGLHASRSDVVTTTIETTDGICCRCLHADNEKVMRWATSVISNTGEGDERRILLDE